MPGQPRAEAGQRRVTTRAITPCCCPDSSRIWNTIRTRLERNTE
jgi:hypothetical protein